MYEYIIYKKITICARQWSTIFVKSFIKISPHSFPLTLRSSTFFLLYYNYITTMYKFLSVIAIQLSTCTLLWEENFFQTNYMLILRDYNIYHSLIKTKLHLQFGISTLFNRHLIHLIIIRPWQKVTLFAIYKFFENICFLIYNSFNRYTILMPDFFFLSI